MTSVSRPIVNITKAEVSQTELAEQRALIVGQQTGSVFTSGQLVSDIPNDGSFQNDAGKDSHITQMVNRFKELNQDSNLDVIVLDDNGGATAAIITVAFSGTATANGTIIVNVGSRRDHKYSLDVAIDDTATVVGAELVTQIGLDDFAIVTGVNTTGSVALTAANGGTIGNDISVEVLNLPAGITATLTNTTPGATDPVLTSVFDVVGDNRYQHIVWPGQYDNAEVADVFSSTSSFLDPRWDADNAILDGVALMTKTDTVGNLKTFLDSRNSQSLYVNCTETVSDALYKGGSTFELNDVQSSEIVAIWALRLTEGSNLSQFVLASNNDVIGGPALSSLPHQNTPTQFPVIDTGKGFTSSEVDDLNDSGGFVAGNNKTKTSVILDTVFSTRKTDAAGNPAPTFQTLNRTQQASIGAEYVFNQIKVVLGQTRFTDGPAPLGRNIINEKILRGLFIQWFTDLTGPDFLIYRGGDANAKLFADSLSILFDFTDGKATVRADVKLVGQLRELDVILRQLIN